MYKQIESSRQWVNISTFPHPPSQPWHNNKQLSKKHLNLRTVYKFTDVDLWMLAWPNIRHFGFFSVFKVLLLWLGFWVPSHTQNSLQVLPVGFTLPTSTDWGWGWAPTLFEGWLFPLLGRTASSWLESRDDRLSRQLHFGFLVCRNGGCDMGCEEEPVSVCVVFPPPAGAQN